jgi:hypothetical protein
MNFYFGAKNVNATDAETPSGSGAKARSFPPSKSQKKKKKLQNEKPKCWSQLVESRLFLSSVPPSGLSTISYYTIAVKKNCIDVFIVEL